MALPCFNPKNPLAVKFRVGASPARESKEQSHAGRAPTIEGSSIGQSGFNQKIPSVFLLVFPILGIHYLAARPRAARARLPPPPPPPPRAAPAPPPLPLPSL